MAKKTKDQPKKPEGFPVDLWNALKFNLDARSAFKLLKWLEQPNATKLLAKAIHAIWVAQLDREAKAIDKLSAQRDRMTVQINKLMGTKGL